MGGHGNMNKNGGSNGTPAGNEAAVVNGTPNGVPGTGNGNTAAVTGPVVAPANGNGNGAAEETVLNEYMTWSVALNAARNDEAIKKKMENVILSKAEDGTPLTFGDFFEKNADAVDLGGGDQGKITVNGLNELIQAAKKKVTDLNNAPVNQTDKKAVKEAQKAMKKAEEAVDDLNEYSDSETIFTTGGSDEERLENLTILKKKGVNSHVSALTLVNETALTAVSYYDYAIDKLQKSEYKNILAIPIGSTDVHVINYDENGTVEARNLANYKTGDATKISEFVSKHVVEGETLIVFAASAYYTIGKKLKVIDAEAVIGERLPKIFTKDYYEEAGEKGKPKLDDLYTVLEKLKIISSNISETNSVTREVTDKFKKINFTVSNSKQEGKKKPLTLDAFQAVYKQANRTLPQRAVNAVRRAIASTGPSYEQIKQGMRSKKFQQQISNARGKISNKVSGLFTRRMFGKKKNPEEEGEGSTGGRKRRTRKVNKNRRKTMKAKNMRRKNKNKSSKGKKSKASRRR